VQNRAGAGIFMLHNVLNLGLGHLQEPVNSSSLATKRPAGPSLLLAQRFGRSRQGESSPI